VANRKIEAFFVEFPLRSQPSPPHRHEGTELIYVIKGRLAVNIDGKDITLDEGDALCFDSGTPHFYRREGRAACAAIVVVSPK
jgi:quercetin dioxygenase-like cupin family protein